MPIEFEDELAIEMATDDDWEEMMPGFVEGTYMSLGPSEREDLGPGTVRENIFFSSNSLTFLLLIGTSVLS